MPGAGGDARTAARDFITALESVRGIAALAVLIQHACWVLAGRDWGLLRETVWTVKSNDELLRRIVLAVFNGNAAVSLFFVLSGFVLALSLRRDERTPRAKVSAFAGRRLLRIYPALAVSLVLTVAVLGALAALFPAVAFPTFGIGQLASDLLLTDFKINGPTWTMLAELLAIPLLLVCHFVTVKLGMRGLMLMVALCVAGLFVGGRVAGRLLPGDGPFWTVVYAYLVDYQFMFAFGMLVAEWRARSAPRLSVGYSAAILGVAIMALLSARALFGFAARPALLIEGVASGAIVAVLAAGPRTGAHTFLEWRPVRFLGRVSYSFYLYHLPSILIVMAVLTWMMTEPWIAAWPYASAAAVTAGALALTIPLAWASYGLIERPSIRLGRRL